MRNSISRYLRVLSSAAALSCAVAASVGAVAAFVGAAAAGPASAHPDLSGVWGAYTVPGEASVRQLRSEEMQLPFTAGGRKKVSEYRALVTPTDDSPGKFCLGYGLPESMVFSGGYPMEITQGHDMFVVLYEAHHEVRHFYLGEKIIAPGDRIPDRDGYSTARWEGDTLVVETTSLKEQEDEMYPHSADARIVERYHLTHDSKGTRVLVDDWTLIDPAFYTKPITSVKSWAYLPKGILLPYECDEETWLDHLQALEKSKGAATPVY